MVPEPVTIVYQFNAWQVLKVMSACGLSGFMRNRAPVEALRRGSASIVHVSGSSVNMIRVCGVTSPDITRFDGITPVMTAGAQWTRYCSPATFYLYVVILPDSQH